MKTQTENKFFDVHCHLDFPQYDDNRDEIIQEAINEGISRIIVNGTNHKTNENALKLAKKYDVIKAANGLHPMDVKDYTDKQIDSIIEKIGADKENIVAIGEVGLDNKRAEADLLDEKRQLKTFQKLIDLSLSINKPLIIHSRKAELKVIEMLEANNAKNPVLHAFMGKKKYVHRAADNGYYFSISPLIKKLEQIKHLVHYTPIGQLLLETDSPYMSPDENMNTPKNVTIAVREIAKIKNMTEKEVKDKLWDNYLKLFEPKNI